jgi:hypothetical protein
VAENRPPKAVLTTYFEATAEAARQSDEQPWLAALLSLVGVVAIASLLVLWLA